MPMATKSRAHAKPKRKGPTPSFRKPASGVPKPNFASSKRASKQGPPASTGRRRGSNASQAKGSARRGSTARQGGATIPPRVGRPPSPARPPGSTGAPSTQVARPVTNQSARGTGRRPTTGQRSRASTPATSSLGATGGSHASAFAATPLRETVVRPSVKARQVRTARRCWCCLPCIRCVRWAGNLSRTVVWQGHNKRLGGVVDIIPTDDQYVRASYARPGTVRGVGATRWLFTAGADGDVRQYDIHTAQCVSVYDVSSSAVVRMEIIPEFRPFLSVGKPSTAQGASHSSTSNVGAVDMRPYAGHVLLVCSTADARVHVYSITDEDHIVTLTLFRDPVAAFLLQGGLMYCGSQVCWRRACVLVDA